MKLELVTRNESENYFAKRFVEESSLTYEKWKVTRDRLEDLLSRHGMIDRGGLGKVGDFSVADDWFGTRTLHVIFNSRKMISGTVLEGVLRLIEETDPEYGVTFVGTYRAESEVRRWARTLGLDRRTKYCALYRTKGDFYAPSQFR